MNELNRDQRQMILMIIGTWVFAILILALIVYLA